MYKYSLGTYPNQQFSVDVNGVNVTFRLRTFRSIVYASAIIDEVTVCGGVRCVPNQYILPIEAQRKCGGNFRFITTDGEYPHPDNFNLTTCKFVFENTDEMES